MLVSWPFSRKEKKRKQSSLIGVARASIAHAPFYDAARPHLWNGSSIIASENVPWQHHFVGPDSLNMERTKTLHSQFFVRNMERSKTSRQNFEHGAFQNFVRNSPLSKSQPAMLKRWPQPSHIPWGDLFYRHNSFLLWSDKRDGIIDCVDRQQAICAIILHMEGPPSSHGHV
jgi:hypothetical protein